MIVYRIRHIPTRLYYRPVVSGHGTKKSNLHKDGKVYHNKPTLKHISHGFNDGRGRFCRVLRGDWEIVGYRLIEIRT